MKANKNHISLETAKLLKDCGVESKYRFCKKIDIENNMFVEVEHTEKSNFYTSEDMFTFYPAFTWQEILWEHAEEFFGKQDEENFSCNAWILCLLQQKKYDEADLYFREHCILIDKNKQGQK